MTRKKHQQLEQILAGLGCCSVAVSGGVDSMTLAGVAHQVLGDKATMIHAVSAAVPSQATQRVRRYAKHYGWNLKEIDAGELTNPDYQRNPANRCYYCKSSLYSSIARLESGVTVSGTNIDDLSDYRPGLVAAKEQNVRHPYVEANITKAELRQIATTLGFDDLADLPASPCLASRVETGIPIQIMDLEQVNAIEVTLQSKVEAENVRCRVKESGLELQLDKEALEGMTDAEKNSLLEDVTRLTTKPLSIAPYQKGSAFRV